MVVYDTFELKEQFSDFQRNYCHMLRNYKNGVYNGLEVEMILNHMNALNNLFKPITERKLTREQREDNKANNDIVRALIPLALYMKMNVKNNN